MGPIADFFSYMKFLPTQVIAALTLVLCVLRRASSTIDVPTSPDKPHRRWNWQLSGSAAWSLRVPLFLLGLGLALSMDPTGDLHQVAGTSHSASRQASRHIPPHQRDRGGGRGGGERMFDPSHTHRQERKLSTPKKRKRASTPHVLKRVQLMTWNARGLRAERHTCGLLAHLEAEWPHVDILLLTESNLPLTTSTRPLPITKRGRPSELTSSQETGGPGPEDSSSLSRENGNLQSR